MATLYHESAGDSPAHYLIVHPKRERCSASGRCLTRGGMSDWSGDVWADPRNGGNEDPFIWSNPWLYSYCKATGIRRHPRRHGRYVAAGSILIFADKDYAKRATLLIDTVFHIGALHIWGSRPPSSLKKMLTAEDYRRAYDRHLRFGLPGASTHKGSYTYSSLTLEVFHGCGSFIPLGPTGDRISIRFSDLDNKLEDRLRRRLKHRLPPIMLSDQEVTNILNLTWIRTRTAVTRVHEMRRSPLSHSARSHEEPCPPHAHCLKSLRQTRQGGRKFSSAADLPGVGGTAIS
jgi:hypothetical protein